MCDHTTILIDNGSNRQRQLLVIFDSTAIQGSHNGWLVRQE